LLLVALAAAVLLVAADFSTISFRTIGIGACSDRVDPGVCRTAGHDSHSYVLVVVGAVALLMAWGAVVGRSRAAAVAVAALGVVVLFIALVIDLPKLDDKRGLEVRYNDVFAHTGSAFKLELTGGVLLLLVGGLSVIRSRMEGEPWQPSGRLRAGLRRGRGGEVSDGGDGSEGAVAGDGEDLSGLTPAEARARERARRRAAQRGGTATAPAPPAEAPPPAMDAPPPAGDAPPPEGEPAPPARDAPPPVGDAPPPEGEAPPPEGEAPPPVGESPPPLSEPSAADGEASATPEPNDATEPQPADPDIPMGSRPDDGSTATPDEGELGPEAYRPPSAEPEPPARS
jgi:hypothetical protein